MTNLTMYSFFVLWLTVYISIRSGLKAHEIILYTSIYFTGNITTVSISDAGSCTNLPEEFKNKIESTEIRTSCAHFYNEPDCRGKGVQLYPSSFYQGILYAWDIDKTLISIGTCRDPCIPLMGQSVRSIKMDGKTAVVDKFQIRLYSKNKREGKEYKIEIIGCTYLQHTHIYYHTFRSIDLPKGTCFLAFLSDHFVPPGGGGDSNACVVENEFNVLEFRGEMENLGFLPEFVPHPNSTWVEKKYVKALSPCLCDSFQNSEPGYNLSMGDGYLELFSEHSFGGEFIKIELNFTSCLNLSDVDHGRWDRSVVSFQVVNNSCVEIHLEQDCLSHAFFVVSMPFTMRSLPDSLYGDIRSLNVCNLTENEPDERMVIMTERDKTFIRSMVLYCLIPLTCIGFLTSAVFIVIILRIKQEKNMHGQLSEKEIKDFINGVELESGSWKVPKVGKDQAALKNNIHLLAQRHPYNYQLEIAKHRIKQDNTKQLDAGEFGNLFTGTLLEPDESSQAIFIKSTEGKAMSRLLRVLLLETKIRMLVGPHPNIVNLMGCSTANMSQDKLFIVLEYCQNGSLSDYLKANKLKFVNICHKQKLQLQQPVNKSNASSDQNFNSSNSHLPSPNQAFDIHQLITWSIEIAEGMEFLTAKGVVQTELSGRYILLTAMNATKIYNFGIPREMYHGGSCGEKDECWRWLSLESLKNLEFSTESDIWSFGILLWEIFTLGEQPYPGVLLLTNDFIRNLSQGVRPTIPTFATGGIYNVMSSCWDENPKMRPTFTFLKSILQQLSDE